MGGTPGIMNSQGSSLSDADTQRLYGYGGSPVRGTYGPKNDPSKIALMLTNWLTAGGSPKPIDPSQVFANDEKLAKIREKAATGQGINSLFGIGEPLGTMQAIKPLEPIKPINQSPMQPGVPYSVPPVTPIVGGK